MTKKIVNIRDISNEEYEKYFSLMALYNNDDESAPTKSIPNGGFSDTTFYKNGVAEVNSTYDNVASAYYGEHPKGEVIDNKRYILFNDDLLQKLNYSKDNVDEYSTGYMMYYCKDGNRIHKILKKDLVTKKELKK